MQLLIKAYVPALNKSLGVFLPLIVVNCIILGRAEMFASKNPVLPSIVDGLGMGVGFTAALLAMGIIRELLGAGTVFGIPILSNFIDPIIIFLLPPGRLLRVRYSHRHCGQAFRGGQSAGDHGLRCMPVGGFLLQGSGKM